MSHIPTLFAVAGSICMSSCLSVVLKQAGREDGAQMLSLITMIITILIFLGRSIHRLLRNQGVSVQRLLCFLRHR